MRCHNDVYYMDLTGLVPAESMAAMGSMEMTFSGDALEFPRNMSVGQSLPDATGSFKASTGGLSLMSMTFDYTDRKVEDKTNITTPAGTFDCYKISYTMNMKFMGKRSYKVVQYFNSEAGAVRTENYDQKGELESYTVLTKFSK